jgi:hypothetical protein
MLAAAGEGAILADQRGPGRQSSVAVERGQNDPLKVAERFSLTRYRTSEIMRARQSTRTAQQGCGAVAAGQLDTEDEADGGSSQPLFLGCQMLTGALGLARQGPC